MACIATKFFIEQLMTNFAVLVCCHLLPLIILKHVVQCFLLNVQDPQLMHLVISLSIEAMIELVRALIA
jgi:hypothetical protein